MTNAVAVPTVSARYSAWGEAQTSPLFGYASPGLFGYTGRETGGPSWYFRARYYNAVHGRFLSEDSTAPPQQSLYSYVTNMPTAAVDPMARRVGIRDAVFPMLSGSGTTNASSGREIPTLIATKLGGFTMSGLWKEVQVLGDPGSDMKIPAERISGQCVK